MLVPKKIWLHFHWSTHPCGNCKKLHTCPLFDILQDNYANWSFKFIYLSHSLDRLASKFLLMINRSSRKEAGPENIIIALVSFIFLFGILSGSSLLWNLKTLVKSIFQNFYRIYRGGRELDHRLTIKTYVMSVLYFHAAKVLRLIQSWRVLTECRINKW